MIELKRGQTTKDRRLDRVVYYDERSKQFPIRELVATQKPRSYTWGLKTRLDQGQEGACVGFSWSHELAASPVVVAGITNESARQVYFSAQQLDTEPGGAYPGAKPYYEGTDVLSGAKAVEALGKLKEYRWAFNLDDVILAVGHQGPGILGTNWYEGQMDTDSKGFIHVTGKVVGGHAICVRGVNVTKKYFTLANSWGASWGKGGDCYISFDDFEKLLLNDGEFCIPVGRKK